MHAGIHSTPGDVVVIDDDAPIRELITELLADEGYIVHHAGRPLRSYSGGNYEVTTIISRG
jgi:CheY-like chemotaxis protein